MKWSRKTILTYLGCILLLVMAWACHFPYRPIPDTNPARSIVAAAMYTIRNVIILSTLFAWGVSLHRRIVHAQVRKLMISVAALLAFWLFVRHCKFEYTMSVHDTLGRYIWYSYYIPMVLVPLLGVFIVDYIGKPEGYRPPKRMNALFIPAGLFILAVFTNDLHQMVFAFPEGFYWYDTIYNYKLLYFFIMGWFVLLGIYFVVALIRKCRIPGSRKMQVLPLLVMGFAMLFWAQYCLNIFRDLDLTAIDCLIIAALLESAVISGLIPVNTNYDDVFRMSTVAMQIVDNRYERRFASATAADLSKEKMKMAERGPVEVGTTLLRSMPLIGGRALWQDEVSQVRMLQDRLKETQLRLQENNDLLRKELTVKRQKAQLDEAHRLYDRIAQESAPQLDLADRLFARLEQEPEHTKQILMWICVVGAYIKRRENLMLMGEEAKRIRTRELMYAVREVLDNLCLGDVAATIQEQCEGEADICAIVDAFDCFAQIVERLMEDMTAVMVHLNCKQGQIQMRVQIGCSQNIPEQALSGIAPSTGTVQCQLSGEDAMIRLAIAERSDDKC